MKLVIELLALIRDERDSLLPFFDAFSQLGSAYDDLARAERGAEFEEVWSALEKLPGCAESGGALQEFAAARAWLVHMARAFADERAAGKWPEVLKPEAVAAIERLNAAIRKLE